MASFNVIPAIDLRGGRVVRLRQGDFSQETVYGGDPSEVADRFVSAGVRWIHIVDLDGARAGEPRQEAAVRRVVETVRGRASCEVAGGLRAVDAVERAFGAGAARVVIGTAALADPAFARRIVEEHGEDAVVVSLDVREGLAVGDGWRPGAAARPVEDALGALANAGIRLFEVTAIDRDGLLGGPDIDLLRRLIALDRGAVIASGGMRSILDLRAVKGLGCAGAIVGTAIYAGTLDLADAIAALETEGSDEIPGWMG
ncbi:MAG TPA: 1-(5-phosphoribosyl)-5-[(5-phosphoribosylamino)methylideneamino] imidazole-4-carboxamide isomerase [Candidatus Limnocylindrales bacterium]